MSGVQILILIVGAILFTVSFFVPEKTASTKEIREKEEKAVKDIIEKEMAGIHNRIDEATVDTVEHAKETAERAMERLTNEKIMAINEYSDTVLDEIHRNHEEAVFLFDMLNNKHAQVKTTTAELNQVIKSAKQAPVATQDEAKKEKKTATSKAKKKPQEEPVVTETVEENQFESLQKEDLEVVSAVSTNEERVESNVEVMLGADADDSNSNDQILELHKAGKSNMAIARELGLGIGEVKLVIDLFEGGM